MTKKRCRPIHLHVMVSEAEQALIQERMAEAGIRNMGAYMRKMALSGYVLHVDLSPVRELSLIHISPFILPLAVLVIIAGPCDIAGWRGGMFAQCKSTSIFQHNSLQNRIALIFVHSTPPVSYTHLDVYKRQG